MRVSDFLPVLGVISGIFALFVDRQKSKSWTALVVVGIVLAAGISIGANLYDESQTAKADAAAHAADQAHMDAEFQQLRVTILAQAGATTETVSAASVTQLSNSVEAVQMKQKLVSKIPESQRADLQIQYFPHFKQDVNVPVMVAALRQITPNVKESSATAAVNDLPTNCVWAGDQVTPQEVHAVALALVGAGIRVRDIRQLKDGSGAHARLIQIGASAKVENFPVIAANQIESREVRSRTDPAY